MSWWTNKPEVKPAAFSTPEPKPKFEPKPLLFSRYFFAEFQPVIDEYDQPWCIYSLSGTASGGKAGKSIFYLDTNTNAVDLMKALDEAMDSAKPTESA